MTPFFTLYLFTILFVLVICSGKIVDAKDLGIGGQVTILDDDGGGGDDDGGGGDGGEGEEDGGGKLILIHGVLMSLAFLGLFPFGAILAARKEQLIKGASAKGVHWWFQTHRAVMLTATGCALAAFIIALTKFETEDEGEGEIGLNVVHAKLGITVS